MEIKRPFCILWRFVTDRSIRFSYLAKLGVYDGMSDEDYLKRLFKLSLGYNLDLNNPKTFNEKTQWLKLYAVKDYYSILADKFEVKDVVGKAIGYEHIIPTIATWDRAEDIDFSALPDSFVLKCNHTSSTGVIICKEKNIIDENSIRLAMKKAMESDYSNLRREKQYGQIKRKILAEELISGENGKDIDDYKVFVFNGKARLIQVDYDRFTDHHRNFYDIDWNYLPFTTCYPSNSEHGIEQPKNLGELIDLAEKLSAEVVPDIPFVRTDFYITDDKIYFGEITFYHGAGIERFYPEKYDRILGDMIDLSSIIK